MRRVYQPPTPSNSWVRPALWTIALALGVFLVLPITQKLSAERHKNLLVRQADVSMDTPQAAEEPPPPPPEEDKPEEPPPPQLADTAQPLSLSIDLDIALGSGGALAGLGSFGASGEGGGIMDTFSIADLEKKPEVIAAVSPDYPPDMRKAKIEGTVTIVFILDEQGRILEPRVDSSTRPEFEKAALDALRKWKYKPGMKEGEPVRTYMRQPFRFRVNQ